MENESKMAEVEMFKGPISNRDGRQMGLFMVYFDNDGSRVKSAG